MADPMSEVLDRTDPRYSRQVMRTLISMGPHIVAFVARVDDVPAAAAMTIVTHGVAGIYWVGTVPTMRGRGLARSRAFSWRHTAEKTLAAYERLLSSG